MVGKNIKTVFRYSLLNINSYH